MKDTDGVSKPLESARASLSRHYRTEPYGIRLYRETTSGPKQGLQSISQMPPADQMHLCIICLARHKIGPTQPSGLSMPGKIKQNKTNQKKPGRER